MIQEMSLDPELILFQTQVSHERKIHFQEEPLVFPTDYYEDEDDETPEAGQSTAQIAVEEPQSKEPTVSLAEKKLPEISPNSSSKKKILNILNTVFPFHFII